MFFVKNTFTLYLFVIKNIYLCHYNSEEKSTNLKPIELSALFHYRHIRIHPFEDGNGRIARLLVNFILLRHNYPMVVVLSRKKRLYLNSLGMADAIVGPVPSDGAMATIDQIPSFVKYMSDLMIAEISQNISPEFKQETQSVRR